jgi:RNA polymerase sigma-70 factor (ECF subfamily)
MSAADEQQLILQSKEGNVQAFRLLVERYMKQAYNIAYGVVNHHDEAEDIAQESFVRIYQSIGSFRGDAQFSTWLYRIVMNFSLNKMSQKKNRVRYEVSMRETIQVEAGCSHTPHHQPDVQMHIERAIHKLPTLQRAVVILRHLNGLSTKQVSGILQCSEGTVKTHLHRGLKKMRVMLDFLENDER